MKDHSKEPSIGMDSGKEDLLASEQPKDYAGPSIFLSDLFQGTMALGFFVCLFKH